MSVLVCVLVYVCVGVVWCVWCWYLCFELHGEMERLFWYFSGVWVCVFVGVLVCVCVVGSVCACAYMMCLGAFGFSAVCVHVWVLVCVHVHI